MVVKARECPVLKDDGYIGFADLNKHTHIFMTQADCVCTITSELQHKYLTYEHKKSYIATTEWTVEAYISWLRKEKNYEHRWAELVDEVGLAGKSSVGGPVEK